jgi:hypothetical protein
MKKSIMSCSIVSLLVLFSTQSVSAQQVAKMTTQGTGYLEYLPPGYAANPTKKYPLLIFLHGLGESGSGSPADLERVKANGPPKLISQGSTMCFTINGNEECFIVLSPQLGIGSGGWWPSIQQSFFDYAINGPENYRIDKTRVYLTGLSLGGQGVYMGVGATTDIFAAGAVIAGWDNTEGCTISARKIALWGFHGTADGTISYSAGLGAFNNTVNCTSPNPTAELKWTAYTGVGHDSWSNAYRVDNSLHTPNLYQWLLSKSKTTGNSPPLSNAGSDQTITLPTSSLSITGSATDTDGTISSYAWTKVSGPSATLTNANTATLSLTSLVQGIYTFRLLVTDNGGATASDDVIVTVNAALSANAGADQTITLPNSSLTITSTTTGTVSSYAWTKVSGPTATLANANTATLSLSALVQGAYIFRLTVTGNAGATASDEVAITVNPDPSAAASDPSLTYTASANYGINSIWYAPGTEQWSFNQENVSASGNTHLEFFVRQWGNTTGFLKVEVADFNVSSTNTLDVSNYAAVTGAFTKVTIPLSAFSPSALTALRWITFRTEPNKSIEVKGIRFVGGTTTFVYFGAQHPDVGRSTSWNFAPSPSGRSATSEINTSGIEGTPPSSIKEEEFVFLGRTYSGANYIVVIYDSNANIIYSGEWKSNMQSEVLKAESLYIFKVYQKNKQIDSGKVLITER